VTPRRYPAWLPVAGLVFVAVAASISGLGNQFAQDDFPIIWKNPAIHDLGQSWKLFAQPYWPPPFTPDLYRPLAVLSYAIQWAVGDGSPLIFRLASYLLYAIVGVQVFRLARLALPFPAAFSAGALFAAHPVHVEAVAMAVNQGELWVGLLSCLAVLIYVRARRAGGSLGLKVELGLAGLYLLALLFKENAVVLPGLLIAAELFLVPDQGWRFPVSLPRRFFLLLTLVAVSWYGVRTLVLAGDLVGTFAAEALAYLSVGERGLTMLAVVPHWFRLLFWPAHLQSDYSPGEIVSQTTWGADQTLGLLLLVAALLVAVASRWRAPAIAFGVLWAAITLLPVHNVLVPTGIVLAERTLFLPSIGVMIAVGGLGALLLEKATPRARAGLTAVVGALLILGVYRSTTRHPVWSDQFNLWFTTANRDAPKSYRAHHALAELYFLAGAEARAEQEYRLAIQYSPTTVSQVYLDYATKLRMRGYCYPAAQLYRTALKIRPNNMAIRASLVSCLVHLGEYREARDLAKEGVTYGWQVETWIQIRYTADSALRVGAPPGTVKLVAPSDSVGAYLNVGRVP